MDFQNIKPNVETISLPPAARSRIKAKLLTERSWTCKKPFPKPILAGAFLALCLCVPVAAGAAGRSGQFRDVFNWQHAVVGTAYDNATEEIAVTAQWSDGILQVTAVIGPSDQAPYRYAETFSINSYLVLDAKGKTICKGTQTETISLENPMTFRIPLSKPLSEGATLVIDSFLASAKAEQPLPISGNWSVPIQIP